MGLLLAWSILWPMAIGFLLVFWGNRNAVQAYGLMAGVGGLLLGAVYLAVIVFGGNPIATEVGGWPAAVGISLRADGLAVIMVLVSATIGFCGALFASDGIAKGALGKNYSSFFLLLLAGVNGSFLTGDLFNLYVWFEVMLMASFCLLVVSEGKFTFRGSTKYVALNVISSFFFLAAVGLLYGKLGTVDMNDLSMRLAREGGDFRVLSSAAMLFVAFAVKAGAFPLYFWLPPAYPQAGFATAAVFGGLLTKVGVYSLIRVFGDVFIVFQDVFGPILLAFGLLTMVMGVVSAMSQITLRRILSFHVISQIGYMLIALGLFSAHALAAVVFYIVHHIIVKANLFLAAGLMAETGKTEDLTKLGGLLRRQPLLAGLFLIPALSLAGIPPLSGFFAKFIILKAVLVQHHYILFCAMLVVGFLTLFSMIKVWDRSFWEKPTEEHPPVKIPANKLAAVLILSVLSVLIGMFAGPVYQVAAAVGTDFFPEVGR